MGYSSGTRKFQEVGHITAGHLWKHNMPPGTSLFLPSCGFINHGKPKMKKIKNRGKVKENGAWETSYPSPKNEV